MRYDPFDMALIELSDVTKTYPQGDISVTALRHITLSVHRGELLCIAGPSGSGKSTLLNMMGILDVPTTGTVRIDGHPTGGLSRSAAALLRRDLIGFVFQSFNLIQVLTAWENVEYGLILRNIPARQRKSTIRDILEAVDLGDKMQTKVTRLSGGEQQRVAIARAVAGNPKVVLADEPTANLDTQTGLAIIEIFRTMNRDRGTTIIFSSHDTKMTRLAHRTLSMVDGRQVANHS